MGAIASAGRGAVLPKPDPEAIRKLQDKRSDLVDSYTHLKPEGSDAWKRNSTIAAAVVGGSVGLGVALLSLRGKTPLYKGLAIFSEIPAAMIIGGGALGLFAHGIADVVSRPGGEGAKQQVATRKADLEAKIHDVDSQLHDLDGRSNAAMPTLNTTRPKGPSILSTLRQAGFGLGVGYFMSSIALPPVVEGLTKAPGLPLRNLLVPIAGAALISSTVGYINARSERSESQGIGAFGRSLAIGGGVGAASAALAGHGGSLITRLAIGAGAGALLATATHMVTASSKD